MKRCRYCNHADPENDERLTCPKCKKPLTPHRSEPDEPGRPSVPVEFSKITKHDNGVYNWPTSSTFTVGQYTGWDLAAPKTDRQITYSILSYGTPALTIGDDPRYPGTCDRCGGPSYTGLNITDCKNGCQ